MGIVLFEDSAAMQLSPVSLTRPVWSIRCASYSLSELLPASSTITGIVRPHLQTLLTIDWPNYSRPLTAHEGPSALINARLTPTISNVGVLNQFLDQQMAAATENRIIAVRNGWALTVAVIPGRCVAQLNAKSSTDRFSELESIAAEYDLELVTIELPLTLMDYPHDMIAGHMQGFSEAIAFRIDNGAYREVKTGVFVSVEGESETQIPDSCHFDTSDGPVVFEDRVSIGPMSFFRGPVHVGRNSKISEQSSIKDCVAISHTCKVGGEVEGVQTEPYSNKQHFGFLGHSYLGSWINLGAGTCNSDLKNTYGTVNMTYGERKVSTGMQFVGCIMGDYARTAINTSIYTGLVIGVGSSVFGMTPHNVPSFVNCVQSMNQYGILPADVLATIQKRMFKRRDVPQRACDVQLIHDVFALTEQQRDDSWTTEPIAF